jgi:hypothetical protein
MNRMPLPDEALRAMRGLVDPRFSSWRMELQIRLKKRSALSMTQGITGSQRASFALISEQFELYRDLGEFLTKAILRVYTELEVVPTPESDADLKRIFDGYMSGPGSFFRSAMKEHCLAGMVMPSESFEALEAEVRLASHTEIDLLIGRLKADDRKRRGEAAGVARDIFNIVGANARVNLNSQDYSVNILGSDAVFQCLAGAIADRVPDDSTREKALKLCEDLRGSIGDKPAFAMRYGELVALLANHIAVISPFLPALAQFLD